MWKMTYKIQLKNIEILRKLEYTNKAEIYAQRKRFLRKRIQQIEEHFNK